MIRRDYEGGLLLIPQTAHAWVSEQLALRWGNDRFAQPEPWEELMLVAAQHDSGWAEWELAPRIRPDGRPVEFREMDLEEHFAIWQRNWLQDEVLEQQQTYWTQQLAGELPVLALPTDHPRPIRQTFQGATRTFHLSKPLSEKQSSAACPIPKWWCTAAGASASNVARTLAPAI